MPDIFVNMNEALSAPIEVPPPTAEVIHERSDSRAEIPHRLDSQTSAEKISAAIARIGAAREPSEPFAPTPEEVQERIAKLTEQVTAGKGPVGAYIKALAKYGVVMERPAAVPEKKEANIDSLKTSQYSLEQRAAKLANGIFTATVDGNLKAKNVLVQGAESALMRAKVSENAATEVPQREAELEKALTDYTEALKEYVEPREAIAAQANSVDGSEGRLNEARAATQGPTSAHFEELMSKHELDVTIDYMTALKSLGTDIPTELHALKEDIDLGKRTGMSEKQLQPRYAKFLDALHSGDQKLAA